jgi:hypothetical protein
VLWRVGAEGRAASTWRRTIDPEVGSIRRRREVRRSGDAATGRRHRDGWAVRHQFLGWTSRSGVRDVGGSSPRGCGGRWLGWMHREDAGAGQTRGRGLLTDGGPTHGGMTHQLCVLLPFFLGVEIRSRMSKMRSRSLNLLRCVKSVPELAKRPTESLNSVQISFLSQTGLDPHVKLSSTFRQCRLPRPRRPPCSPLDWSPMELWPPDCVGLPAHSWTGHPWSSNT